MSDSSPKKMLDPDPRDPDEAASEAASARLSMPEVIAEIIADEEQLFDRTENRFFTLEEVESQL